jgi:hypothetical protein
VTNILAYRDEEFITVVKSFILQVPGEFSNRSPFQGLNKLGFTLHFGEKS